MPAYSRAVASTVSAVAAPASARCSGSNHQLATAARNSTSAEAESANARRCANHEPSTIATSSGAATRTSTRWAIPSSPLATTSATTPNAPSAHSRSQGPALIAAPPNPQRNRPVSAAPPNPQRIDRSVQTAAPAKPARPEVDIASDVSTFPLLDAATHVAQRPCTGHVRNLVEVVRRRRRGRVPLECVGAPRVADGPRAAASRPPDVDQEEEDADAHDV